MDIADNRRDEMIAYTEQKYGEDHVAQIGTFGAMMARAAVRDVARALGHSYNTGDRIAKLIPMGSQGFPMTIDKALELSQTLKHSMTKTTIRARSLTSQNASRGVCDTSESTRYRRRGLSNPAH